MSGSRRPSGGRPHSWYVERAIELILTSTEPVSTNDLVERLELGEHSAIGLRRGLRRAEKEGRIRMLGPRPRSANWVSKDAPIEACAAHAANLFLAGEHLEPIDPVRFTEWLRRERETHEQNREG